MYPLRKDKIVFREEGDEALLFNPDTGQIKLLNYTGIFIWKLCDGKHSVKDMEEVIRCEFEEVGDKDIIQRDIREFLGQLEKFGFIIFLKEPLE